MLLLAEIYQVNVKLYLQEGTVNFRLGKEREYVHMYIGKPNSSQFRHVYAINQQAVTEVGDMEQYEIAQDISLLQTVIHGMYGMLGASTSGSKRRRNSDDSGQRSGEPRSNDDEGSSSTGSPKLKRYEDEYSSSPEQDVDIPMQRPTNLTETTAEDIPDINDISNMVTITDQVKRDSASTNNVACALMRNVIDRGLGHPTHPIITTEKEQNYDCLEYTPYNKVYESKKERLSNAKRDFQTMD
jgi:hypothetical protein